MLRVLIVDDDVAARALLATALAADDVQVATAESFAAAVDRIDRHDIDVALVDKNLPDGSGLDVILHLKARRPEAESILVTGFASLASAIVAVEVGAYDYLLKPIDDLDGLRLKVRNAAEKVRLRRVEKQLLQGQKMEAMGRLASGVAHDFNNLLSVMINAAAAASELVNKGDVGPETREHLQAVMASAESATRLTRQLQAFSRRPPGAPEVLDVNEVVTELAQLLGRLVGEDRKLDVQLAGGAPPVKMARSQLEQVLVNVVLSARDLTGPGGVVRVRSEKTSGGGVALTISESGGGRLPEATERMFEPVVLGIVERANGTVTVESSHGGTSFRIALPPSPEPTQPRAVRLESFPESVGETVLVAEDDEGVRSLLQRTFTRAGYLVATARNAADASVKFESLGGDVDLLVTDMIMPLMNGRELAQRLRRVRPSLKVIYLSGYNAAELEAKGLGGDASEGPLLTKPFSPDELGRAVRRVLGRS